jgi:hypothetical protein
VDGKEFHFSYSINGFSCYQGFEPKSKPCTTEKTTFKLWFFQKKIMPIFGGLSAKIKI